MIVQRSGLYVPLDVPHPSGLGDVINTCFRFTGDDKRTAIDVGAYVGEWTISFAHHFDFVVAFEPISSSFECLIKNTVAYVNVTRRNEAVWQSESQVVMRLRDVQKPWSWETGPSAKSKQTTVDTTTIDALRIECVDFIKVNVNGSEFRVLKGAQETIQKCKPIVCINEEFDPHRNASAYLRHLGMQLFWSKDNTFLFGWPL